MTEPDKERCMENVRHIENEMQSKADAFLGMQRMYYTGRADDKQLAEQTTQPFWASLVLSKNRLEKAGLTMDTVIRQENNGRRENIGRVSARKDGNNQVGTSSRDVVVDRSFFRQGKRIFHRKEREISHVNLLKSEVNGDMAPCPNCGHLGRISDYIDGCDYCDSKFQVSDFEAKVSGFALEEDVEKKARKTYSRALGGLGVFTLGIIIVMVLAFVLMIGLLLTGQNGMGVMYPLLTYLMSVDLLPIVFHSLFALGIIYLAAGGVLMRIMKKQIMGEAVIKAVLPEFSAYDFYQNLEYQLRAIHLSDTPEQVRSFGNCSLGQAVAGYGDVVDCSLCRLKFCEITETSEGYRIRVSARMKLFRLLYGKIRTRYEQLELVLEGRREILQNNYYAIREYKCPGCGGSVDMLQGGVCGYCGTRLDYSRYGWMIDSYEVKKTINEYRMITALIILIYVLVFAYNFWSHPSITTEDSTSWQEVLGMMQESREAINLFYDQVPLPTDMDPALTVISTVETDWEREYVYEVEDWSGFIDRYQQFMEERGCTAYLPSGADQTVRFYLPITWQGEKGYVVAEAEYDDGKVKIKLELAGAIGE